MRAIDPNSGAVLRKNATTVAAGTAVVLVIIALGWALSKTRWRTAETASARVVEESTESGQAERVIEQGERILANRRSQQFRLSGHGARQRKRHWQFKCAPGFLNPNGCSRRPFEELRRNVDELTIWQGSRILSSWPGVASTRRTSPERANPVTEFEFKTSRKNPESIHGRRRTGQDRWKELESSDDQPIPSLADPSDVHLDSGRFSFGQQLTSPGTAERQPDRRNHMHRLFAGTVISSILLTNVDSGLPGTVRAQVASDVRDSATGAHVLIPGGSFLFGRYGEAQNVHAHRLFIGWDRIQFPNGVSVSPGNAVTSDLSGVAGIKGIRESRLLKALGSAFAINLLASLARREDDSADQLGDAVRRAIGDSAETVSEKLLERDLNQLPTFRVSAGVPMNITLETDLWLPAY